MSLPSDRESEWLEADGLGGFTSGTVSGVRTRRYHALLLTATTPPTGRVVLVNGLDAWIETPAGRFALSSQRYAPGVRHPDGADRIEAFAIDPWPRWTFRLPDGSLIEHELFVPRDQSAVAMRWRLLADRASDRPEATLLVQPFLSGRDYHALHHENPGFSFDAARDGGRVTWKPYSGLPAIVALSNGAYEHRPDWYRNFQYEQERTRGLDFTEDLATPGVIRWQLDADAILILAADGHHDLFSQRDEARVVFERALASESKRRGFVSPLHRAADSYLIRRGKGRTIAAGYPWFTDWGRDTFIAVRGLCIAGDRLDDARSILLEWAGAVSDGMLPNRFPDAGEEPEFNSVDASLWYVVAVHELLQALNGRRRKLAARERQALQAAVEAILDGYSRGTRFGIRRSDDDLLAAGVTGVQLTWMDAKVGDWVVTPRIGKPVEVQALWLNALRIGAQFSERWATTFERGLQSFRARFWNDAGGYLHDVVDVGHQAGTADASFRPNQILAVGGLPFALLEGDQAKRVVDAVEARLLTPLGLRSLAPGEPGYTPRYEGGVRERDGSYHQGTVWPWLLGPFVEAWVRVRGSTPEAKREARVRFFEPMIRHLGDAGLGHVSEIADAEPPHTPRGCPFQAWSVGEALRLDRAVLAP
jgi:predicted glycogen debranching enzyme